MSLLSRPFRVIHVANLPLLPKGAGYFSVSFKLTNGLTRAGCNVLNFSDRDVARASSFLRNRKSGAPGANKKLVEVALEFRPDLILFGHADTIKPETLLIIREKLPNIKLAQWNVDPLFEQDNIDRINRKIDHVDYTFVSTAGQSLADLGKGKYPVSFLPNPVDLSIERHKNFQKSRNDFSYDLFYAAGNPELPRHHAGIKSTAGEVVAQIRKNCPNIRFLSPGCDGTPLAFGKNYEAALASCSMGLNVSRRSDEYLYSSDRIAQMTGSGMLVFIDRATGYTDIFDESTFAFYSTEQELFDKLGHFKDNDQERKRVAENGWNRYREEFDCSVVAQYMIEVIFGERDAAIHKWKQ